MNTDIENRRIRKSENHDIQYIKIYRGLGMVRRANHIIINHATYQKK
jgi:hypothetical protein